MTAPLSGVRVIELASFVAAPAAGALFSRALHGKALSARDEEIARLLRQLGAPGTDAGAVKAAPQRLAAPM